MSASKKPKQPKLVMRATVERDQGRPPFILELFDDCGFSKFYHFRVEGGPDKFPFRRTMNRNEAMAFLVRFKPTKLEVFDKRKYVRFHSCAPDALPTPMVKSSVHPMLMMNEVSAMAYMREHGIKLRPLKGVPNTRASTDSWRKEAQKVPREKAEVR